MRNAQLIEEEAAEWLARQDRGDWGAVQERELEAWLQQATAHRVALLRLGSVWQRADALGAPDAQEDEDAPVAGPDKAAAAVTASRFGGWRIAAGLALASGLALLSAILPQNDRGQVYATRLGESRTVALAEGSRITLNTSTLLRAVVATDKRMAWLDSGEAFFDIAHDSARPFVIEAGTGRITVLGTRFSVRRDGNMVSVLVAEGKVRVRQNGKEVILTGNGAAALSKDGILQSQVSPAQVLSQLGWRDGRLILDQMPLGQAVAEFNRYNARKLVIADPEVAAIRVGGSFSPANVDGFTRLLELGFGLRTERQGERIKISR